MNTFVIIRYIDIIIIISIIYIDINNIYNIDINNYNNNYGKCLFFSLHFHSPHLIFTTGLCKRCYCYSHSTDEEV